MEVRPVGPNEARALRIVAQASSEVFPDLITYDPVLDTWTCSWCVESATTKNEVPHTEPCPVGRLANARDMLARAVIADQEGVVASAPS